MSQARLTSAQRIALDAAHQGRLIRTARNTRSIDRLIGFGYVAADLTCTVAGRAVFGQVLRPRIHNEQLLVNWNRGRATRRVNPG